MFLLKHITSVSLLILVVGILISDFSVPPALGLKCKACSSSGGPNEVKCSEPFEKWKPVTCDKCKSGTKDGKQDCDMCVYTHGTHIDDKSPMYDSTCGYSKFFDKVAPGANCKDFTTQKINGKGEGKQFKAKVCRCKTDLCDPRKDTTGSSSRGSSHPCMVVILSALVCVVAPIIATIRQG